MIEKVAEFPIEELYFLESEDFLVDREKFYFKKNKTIKINSYWLGVSRLRVNNDKLLYLFNGLRGYYDARTRYLKEPEIMENKVPLSKIIYVNDYLIKKYKYKDLFIFSLNLFNRPTITLQKENNILYYWFPTRLAEYLNKQREIKTMELANKQFSKQVRELKDIGFRFSIRYKQKWKKLKYLPSIAVGLTASYLLRYLYYLEYNSYVLNRMMRCVVKRKRDKKQNRRRWFQKFHKTPKAIRLLFVATRSYLKKKNIKAKKFNKLNNKKRKLALITNDKPRKNRIKKARKKFYKLNKKLKRKIKDSNLISKQVGYYNSLYKTKKIDRGVRPQIIEIKYKKKQ